MRAARCSVIFVVIITIVPNHELVLVSSDRAHRATGTQLTFVCTLVGLCMTAASASLLLHLLNELLFTVFEVGS